MKQIARVIALGADMCNNDIRWMHPSIKCNTNTCPVGVTTQNKSLVRGLVVEDNAQRVANYHEKTIKSIGELLAAAGISKLDDLNGTHVNRSVSMTFVLRYDEIYPYLEKGSLL